MRKAWILSVLLGTTLVASPAWAIDLAGWQRIEALVARRAFPVARQELRGELSQPLGEDTPRAQYWLGYVERRLGHGEAARAAFEAIPSQSLWYARAQRELAHELVAQNALDDADTVLFRLIETMTGSELAEVRLELADSLFVRSKFDKAQDLYRRVVEDSTDPAGREHAAYALGWCYERQHIPARATYSWKEALRLFPNSSQARPARMMLANQYLLLGKPLLASDEFRQLAQESKDAEFAARAQFLAGEGYAAVGNWTMAGAAYGAVAPKSRWAEPAEYGRAFARWQGGDLAGARAEMVAWLTRYPTSDTHVAVLYALGRIGLEQGDHAAAREAFEKAITDSGVGRYVEASLFGLAELEYNDKNYAICSELTRRLLRSNPDTAQRGATRWLLAESLLALRQYAEAISVYNEIAQSEPDLSFLEGKGDAVTFRLGLAHFRTGDFPAAASYLRQVVDSAYGKEALFWLAEASYRIGDFNESLNDFGAFRRKYPEADQVAEAAYGGAYSAYQLKRFEVSLPLFKIASDALKPGARRRDALVRLGALQLDAHEWNGALLTYNTLYDSQLSDELLPDVLFGLAWASFRKGANVEAERHALTFLSKCPSSPRLNRVRGIAGLAAFKLGHFPEAIDRFEAVLDDRRSTLDERKDARARIAAAYFNTSQFAKAVDEYQALYGEATPNERGELAQPLVQALIAKGDFDVAYKVTREASASAWVGDTLGRLAQGFMDQGEAKNAVSCLTKIESPSLEQRHMLAEAYRAAGNPEASFATLDEIARIAGPRQLEWLVELGNRYLATSSLEQAREIWGQVAKLKPNHPGLSGASLQLASGYLKAGQDALALSTYRDVAARKGIPSASTQAAQLAIGQLELKAAHHKEAIAAFRAAEKVGPPGSLGAVQARYYLGATLVAARRYEDAVTELAKLKVPAAVGREWEALGALKLGESYEHLRRWKEAIAIYQRMVENAGLTDPERKEAGDRLKWIDENITRRPS